MKKSQQRGAVLNEYVMVLGILLAIFVVVGILLRQTAIQRGRNSIQAVTNNGNCPPGTILENEECL